MLTPAYAALAGVLVIATLAALVPSLFGKRMAPAIAVVGMGVTLVIPQVALTGVAITAVVVFFAGLDDPVALAALGLHIVCWGALVAYAIALVRSVPILDGVPVDDADRIAYLPWLFMRTEAMGLVQVSRGIVYREIDGVRLRLDVYHALGRAPAPVVLFIHGGGWFTGTRGQSRYLCYQLAASGWCVFAISYRLAPRYPLPAAIEDVQSALTWVRGHAGGYGGDPRCVAVIGGSAGGQLASLVALTAQPSVQAAVIFYGATHLTAAFEGPRVSLGLALFLERVVFRRRFADAPEIFRAADPFHRVHGAAPPFLLVHGTKDLLVPIAQSRAFAARLRGAGNREVHLLEVPHALHAFEVFPTPLHQRAVRVVLAFLDRVERTRRAPPLAP